MVWTSRAWAASKYGDPLRPVDDVGHPGGTTYPGAIRAQGIFLRPSSAIAPVQSGRTFRCALRVERVDRAGTFCYSCVLFTPGKRKGVGGPPSASWEDSSRQSQVVFTLFTGMMLREASWLAQGALLTLVNICTLIGRTSSVIVPFLFTSGKRKGSGGPLLRLLGMTVRGNLRWWMLLVRSDAL